MNSPENPDSALDLEQTQGLALLQNIKQIERSCMDMPQVSCNVYHTFGPGIYIREVHIPAGTFAIGHFQKTEHMNILLKGNIKLLDENGEMQHRIAPLMYTAPPGRKVAYALEDVVWLNIYPTTERDVDTLESMYLDKSENWQDVDESVYREGPEVAVNRADYITFLREIGSTEEAVQAIVQDTTDQVELPLGSYGFKLAPSPIHGQGIFATANIEAGTVIAPARIKGQRTVLGRYTNHAINPNAIMHPTPNGDIILVALRDIQGCHGGFTGEEITVCYRDALKAAYKEDTCQE